MVEQINLYYLGSIQFIRFEVVEWWHVDLPVVGRRIDFENILEIFKKKTFYASPIFATLALNSNRPQRQRGQGWRSLTFSQSSSKKYNRNRLKSTICETD